MAAIHAARAGARVVVLEKTPDGGRKILISGGGRCNVLPSVAAPERFVTAASQTLLKRMLRSFPLHEQKQFFEEDAGVPLAREEESGKLFPVSNRARDVRDALVRLATEAGVEFRWQASVTALEPGDNPSTSLRASWRISLDRGEPITTDVVIIATGGLSVPATGSDGIGLAIARRIGHHIIPTYAALTPLLTDDRSHTALSGLSLHADMRAPAAGKQARSSGGFLFTHRGYSGPSVLDVSHGFTRDKGDIIAGWNGVPRSEWEGALLERTGLVATRVASRIPSRLADMLIASAGIPADRRLAELKRDERNLLIERLTSYRLPVRGDEGYKKAEVTGGGLSLDEVDPVTLESRHQAGIFFCGEVLDAFGPIGGHNFQWAWSTGRAAGIAAARTGV